MVVLVAKRISGSKPGSLLLFVVARDSGWQGRHWQLRARCSSSSKSASVCLSVVAPAGQQGVPGACRAQQQQVWRSVLGSIGPQASRQAQQHPEQASGCKSLCPFVIASNLRLSGSLGEVASLDAAAQQTLGGITMRDGTQDLRCAASSQKQQTHITLLGKDT